MLPPVVVYRTGKVDEAVFGKTCDALGQRLDGLFSDAPIPFRKQNGGDYAIPALTLREDVAADQVGFGAHSVAQR